MENFCERIYLQKNNSNQFAVEENDMIGGKLSDESREETRWENESAHLI